MKRDFSDSTRAQLVEIIDNDRAYLYSGDISGEQFFACYEATGEDYSPFYDEIEYIVKRAGTDYLYTDGRIDKLIEEINTVFDNAQAKDSEYARTVELDIHLTVTNLIGDLETLVYALDVNKPSGMDAGDLESLEAGDMGCIFGDPEDFADRLEFVDNPLYEDFIAQFVTASGVDYDAIASFFEENKDELSLWELQAFESILLSYVDPETGELDTEGLEQFMEACYYYVPDANEDGLEDYYYVYQLHDEYAQIFAYYDAHIGAALDAYEGTLDETDPNWSIYAALADMDALLEGVYLHGQFVEVNPNQEDEMNGGCLDASAPNVLDISINSDPSWMYIVYENAENEQINVSHFGPLDNSVIADEYYTQEQLLSDPDDAYINALQEGVGDYVVSQLTGPLEDLIPKPVQEILDVAEIFTDANEAMEEQEAENQEIYENMNSNAHLLLIETANGETAGGTGIPCSGNVISCGGETSLTNHQFDEGALEALVDEYNSENGTSIDADIMIAAVTNPSCVDFTDPTIEQFLGIAQPQ